MYSAFYSEQLQLCVLLFVFLFGIWHSLLFEMEKSSGQADRRVVSRGCNNIAARKGDSKRQSSHWNISTTVCCCSNVEAEEAKWTLRKEQLHNNSRNIRWTRDLCVASVGRKRSNQLPLSKVSCPDPHIYPGPHRAASTWRIKNAHVEFVEEGRMRLNKWLPIRAVTCVLWKTLQVGSTSDLSSRRWAGKRDKRAEVHLQ